MGQKWKNAPVYFTLGQVRFNTILGFESFLPAVQQGFIAAGFPDFKQHAVVSFAIGNGDLESPQVTPARATRITFTNIEQTRGFILEPGALTYQATEYESFEVFSAGLIAGLAAINNAIPGGLSMIERIGLRYLDAIFPRPGEDISLYLAPGVLGLAGRFGSDLLHTFSETVAIDDANTVISRAITQVGPVGFPPDINPAGMLNMPARFQGLNGLHALLDTDAFIAKREAFGLDAIGTQLRSLRVSVGKAFNATVTEAALEIWN